MKDLLKQFKTDLEKAKEKEVVDRFENLSTGESTTMEESLSFPNLFKKNDSDKLAVLNKNLKEIIDDPNYKVLTEEKL